MDWTTGSANGRSNCEWNREEKNEEAEHMRAPDFRLRRKLVMRFVLPGIELNRRQQSNRSRPVRRSPRCCGQTLWSAVGSELASATPLCRGSDPCKAASPSLRSSAAALQMSSPTQPTCRRESGASNLRELPCLLFNHPREETERGRTRASITFSPSSKSDDAVRCRRTPNVLANAANVSTRIRCFESP